MPAGLLPGMWVPQWWTDSAAPAFGSALVINAAGQKAAMCGRVFIPGGGTKNINAVGFRWGAVTSVALETLTLSLQDISATTGFPDEVQDQTATITVATQVTANTWGDTNNAGAPFTLGSTRTVTCGDRLAVVWEFLNFVALSSIVVSSLGSGMVINQECYCALKTGAWAFITAAASLVPNVVLGFDDGTWGTLDGARGHNTLTTSSISTGGGGQVGQRFTTGVWGVMEAVWLFADMDGDLDLNIYQAAPDGTGETLVAGPIHMDKDIRSQTNARQLIVPLATPIVMKPNWRYFVAWNGPTATACTLYLPEYANASYQDAFGPGASYVNFVSRAAVGTGAWSVFSGTPLLCGIRLRAAQYPVRSAGMASTV